MDLRARLVACFVAGLAAACQATLGQGPPEAVATSSPETSVDGAETIEIGHAPAPSPIDWAGTGDCRAHVRLLQAAAAQGALAADARPPIAVIVHDAAQDRLWPLARASFVKLDLPLPTYSWASAAPREACVIEIGPPDGLKSELRRLGRDQVASEYHFGSRSERNPEYDAVKERVARSERRLKARKPGVLSVGDPMLDLIGMLVGGVLSGFSDYGEEQELDEAMVELTRTPRTLERATYRPYTFERTVVHAARHAVIPVLLRDRTRGLEWRAELNQHEFREFRILDGLDPRDRDYEQHRAGSITQPDLESWERRPPELPLSSVVAALADASPTEALTVVASAKAPADRSGPQLAPAPNETLLAMKGPSVSPAAFAAPADGRHDQRSARDGDPYGSRLDSIVRVTAGARSGIGFYVGADLVLTTHRLAGDATVVDLTTAGGQNVPGLLAASDPEHDLALIQSPKPGPPVALAAGPPGGRAIEVLHGEGRAIPLALAADPDGRMLRVRSARLLHDGLTGAPVFLDRTVIGVLVSAGESGEMMMVPASRILEFVRRYAGAIAASH